MTQLQLHMVAEHLNDGKWESAVMWTWVGTRLRPVNPIYRDRPDTYVKPLYAALGAALPEFLLPERGVVASTAGLPKDLDDKTSRYVDQFDVLFAHHVMAFKVACFNWVLPVKRTHKVSTRARDHWRITNIIPSWALAEAKELRVHEVSYSITPLELWGREWLTHTMSRIENFPLEETRIIYFFTEKNLHEH